MHGLMMTVSDHAECCMVILTGSTICHCIYGKKTGAEAGLQLVSSDHQLVAPATLSAAQSLTLLVSSYQPCHTLQCPEVSPPAVVVLGSPL